MRAGKIEQANSVAVRVGSAIIKSNAAQFKGVDENIDAGEMWKKVKQLTSGASKTEFENNVTATDLNEYYASISTDSTYQSPARKQTVAQYSVEPLTIWQVFHSLDHLSPTATGLDGLPAWFLRLGSPFFAEPLTYLYNRALALYRISGALRVLFQYQKYHSQCNLQTIVQYRSHRFSPGL